MMGRYLRWLAGRAVRTRAPSCGEVLRGLQSYLDGETDAAVARRLAGHLHHCPHCDHEHRLYADIKRSLTARRVHVDPDVMAALTTYGQRLARGEIAN